MDIRATLKTNHNGSETYTWTGLDGTNAALPIEVERFQSFQIEVYGTLTSGTMTIEGSLSGVKYNPIKDTTTLAAISQTSIPSSIFVVWEVPNFIRPVFSGAGDITVVLKGI